MPATIRYEATQTTPRKYVQYDQAHNARTILLLSGYLPLLEDESIWINLYTREEVKLTITR